MMCHAARGHESRHDIRGLSPFRPVQTEQVAEHGFLRYAEQHGAPQGKQAFHAAQQREVVLKAFAETDARVQQDVFLGQTGTDKRVHSLLKKGQHLIRHIRVGGRILHGTRPALTVHKHIAWAVRRHSLQHIRFPSKGGNIVNNVRPRFQNRPSHGSTPGIYRDQRKTLTRASGGGRGFPLSQQGGKNRKHAADFLLGGHIRRTGTG